MSTPDWAAVLTIIGVIATVIAVWLFSQEPVDDALSDGPNGDHPHIALGDLKLLHASQLTDEGR